jgi:hypothetical protein
LVAGHKHNAGTISQMGYGSGEQSHLRIPVQPHGVVLAHAGFHAARSVHHQNVEFAERGLRLGEHATHIGGVREISAHDDGLATGRNNAVADLGSASLFVAIVDNDPSTGFGKESHGVCANAAR